MEDLYKTLPQHTCTWLQGRATLYNYQGFWNAQNFPEKAMLAQSYEAQPSDILFYSCPKTDTTWLKALAFAIRLAEFLGHPISIEEEKADMVENIIQLCSFDTLSNLEVNKSGKYQADEHFALEHRLLLGRPRMEIGKTTSWMRCKTRLTN
ncbi:hypothetical protein LXL04_008039 [Taraxacum kok-saghyz]